MLEQIVKLDYQLFFLLNGKLHNSILDLILPFCRNKFFWFPLYLFIVLFLIVNFGKKGFWVILFMSLTLTLSDQFSSTLVKPIFQRLRPCNDAVIQNYVRVLVPCGSGYSFVSSHAANHFAIAIFLGYLFFQKNKWILPIGILWAILVSYSQIYVGLHFPLDVFVGGIFGMMFGFLIARLCKKVLILSDK